MNETISMLKLTLIAAEEFKMITGEVYGDDD